MAKHWQDLIEDILNYDSDEEGSLDKAVDAIDALKEIQDNDCLKELYKLLDCDDFAIREWVASPIANMDGIKALRPLLKSLTRGEEDGHDNDGLCNVLTGLLESNKREAKTILLELLSGDDIHDKENALWAMGFIASEISSDCLLKYLKDPSPKIRATVIGSLTSFEDDPKAFEGIFSALDDEDEKVKIVAIYDIRYFKNPKTIEHLKQMEQMEHSQNVREAINYTLECLKQENR